MPANKINQCFLALSVAVAAAFVVATLSHSRSGVQVLSDCPSKSWPPRTANYSQQIGMALAPASNADEWQPCMKNHPGLCRKSAVQGVGGFYKMRYAHNALDDALQLILANEPHSTTVFHFGSGDYHAVGRANMDLPVMQRHKILSVTASPGEMESYMRFLELNANVSRWYQVLYADGFQLSAALFHIGEYSKTDSQEINLLKQLWHAMKPCGSLYVHTKSAGYQRRGKHIMHQVATSECRFLSEKTWIPGVERYVKVSSPKLSHLSWIG
jgi:hypothetical protein